jgi:hypothetical protein
VAAFKGPINYLKETKKLQGFISKQPVPIFREEFFMDREKFSSLYRAGNILSRLPKVNLLTLRHRPRLVRW